MVSQLFDMPTSPFFVSPGPFSLCGSDMEETTGLFVIVVVCLLDWVLFQFFQTSSYYVA